MAVGTSNPTLVPHCSGAFQLCGYIDPGSKAYRIPPSFEIARPFGEELAAVRVNGRYGYIDTTGNSVIAPRFQAAGRFSGGYAEVRLDGASGIIDRKGRLVIPARFGRIIPFHSGTFVAVVLQGPEDRRTEELPGLSDSAGAGLADWQRGGLYQITRGWLTSQELEFTPFDRPERGLVWVGQFTDGAYLWGLMRSDGTWQVSPRYSYVLPLSETRAVVRSREDATLPLDERRQAVLSGAVDRDGRLVVPMAFSWLGDWRGGYGFVTERNTTPDGKSPRARKGLVRADGKLLANRYFDEIDRSDDGSLPRARLDKSWFSIKPNGRLVQDQRDGKILVQCSTGLKIIERGEEVEFLAPVDGKSIGRFDKRYFSDRDCDGSFSASRNERLFHVLNDGTILGGERGYDNLYKFAGNHAAVMVDGQWGIINRAGRFTVEPRFSRISHNRIDVFDVDEGGDTYWINATGQRVERPAFDKPVPAKALLCEGGLRYFQKAGLWGFLGPDGTTVIEPRFRALSCFREGVDMLPGISASLS